MYGPEDNLKSIRFGVAKKRASLGAPKGALPPTLKYWGPMYSKQKRVFYPFYILFFINFLALAIAERGIRRECPGVAFKTFMNKKHGHAGQVIQYHVKLLADTAGMLKIDLPVHTSYISSKTFPIIKGKEKIANSVREVGESIVWSNVPPLLSKRWRTFIIKVKVNPCISSKMSIIFQNTTFSSQQTSVCISTAPAVRVSLIANWLWIYVEICDQVF